jgi:hypothetical protein
MTKTKILCAAVAFGTTLAAGTSAIAAGHCSPGIVEYTENQLLIQCSNQPAPNNYLGVVNAPPGCSGTKNEPKVTVTVDTLKMWLTMAQAALLAGKDMNLYFTKCGSDFFLTTVDILK